MAELPPGKKKVRVPLIVPDWDAPFRVRAVTTTRAGGVSEGQWARFNLATEVGDDEAAVTENRRRFRVVLGLPEEPRWLKQAHSTKVLAFPRDSADQEADAAITDEPGVICAVLTADCVPVLLCDDEGGEVAAVHVGWRGLASGVIESAVGAFSVAPGRLLAWMGPAIGPDAYEINFHKSSVNPGQTFKKVKDGSIQTPVIVSTPTLIHPVSFKSPSPTVTVPKGVFKERSPPLLI